MHRVAQRLCTCTRRMAGFTHDHRSGFWVCGDCGYPRWEYYKFARSVQPPGVPIKYAKGDAPTQFEVADQPQHHRASAS